MSDESFGNFTPRGQQIVALARKEADRFNHNYVGTEHLLLGIIKLGQGVAVNVLQKLGLDLDTVRLEVEKQVGTGPNQKVLGNIPYTSRVKKVFSLANKEAKALNHTYVGTEHILLGILQEGDGVSAKVLKVLNVDIERTREEILKELDPNYKTEGASEVEVPRSEEVTGSPTIDELAGQSLELVGAAALTSGLHVSDPRRRLIFAHLRLLLRIGYNFHGMTMELALRLVCPKPTIEELVTLRDALKVKNPDGLADLQRTYDETDAGSVLEMAAGRLIQVWTGKPPRKLGPEVDWLAGMDPACTVVAHADGTAYLTTAVVPAEAPDASRVVTGGASITHPPPGGEH